MFVVAVESNKKGDELCLQERVNDEWARALADRGWRGQGPLASSLWVEREMKFCLIWSWYRTVKTLVPINDIVPRYFLEPAKNTANFLAKIQWYTTTLSPNAQTFLQLPTDRSHEHAQAVLLDSISYSNLRPSWTAKIACSWYLNHITLCTT